MNRKKRKKSSSARNNNTRTKPAKRITNANRNSAKISACMIVKNEETMLPRCLASIRDIADEIILVDTGSDDRTVEIAEQFDCRIFYFPWTGNFAEARNESLRHAEGDWIFIIDADEELPSGQAAAIRRAVNDPQVDIISLSVYNKSLQTGQVSSFLPSIRFFRRKLELSYEGIVHNRLTIPSSSTVTRCDMKLFHYGYDLSPDDLQKKKNRSIKLLKKQLQENPDDAFAHFNMAQLLRGMNGISDNDNCKKIIEHALRVIEIPDNDSTGAQGYRLMAHIQAASAMCTLGKYDEAENYCRKALDTKPDYIDAVITLANICLATGKIEEAQNYYRQYLELLDLYNPEHETADIILHYLDAHFVAWYGMATAARIDGRIDEALKCYRRVLDGDRTYLDTFYQLGNLYLETGQPHRAEEMFCKEIETSGTSATAYYGIARALVSQSKADRAVEYLRKAIDLDPSNLEIGISLGKILIALGQPESGLACMTQILESTADDWEPYFTCANLLFEAGMINEALSFYQKALQLQPGNTDVLNNIGNCYFRLEKYQEACSTYEQLLVNSPDYIPAYRNLGLAFVKAGNNRKGFNALVAYADKTPHDIQIYRLIGDLLLSMKLYDRAIACYQKYLPNNADDTGCLLNLSECYFNLGHFDAARKGFEQVLAVDSECKFAQNRMGSILQPGAVT